MRIIYNGVDLGVLELYAYDWDSVYDDSGVDYLCTRVSLLVRAVVSGLAQVVTPQKGRPFNGPMVSYAFSDTGGDASLKSVPGFNAELRTGGTGSTTVGQIGAAIGAGVIGASGAIPAGAVRDPVPTEPAGDSMNLPKGVGIESFPPSRLRQIVRVPNFPNFSHATIRHRLNTPRGKLFVFAGLGQESGGPDPNTKDPPNIPAVLSLESPVGDFPTDCRNGPKPKVLAVHMATGDAATLVVDFSCETYINEAVMNDVSLVGALLSNRFAQSHSIDDDGYTTITTAGTAIFRTDFVFSLPESPDFKRPVLFMPVPQGFRRSIPEVTGRADVTGIDYSYVDTQVPVNFAAGPFVKAARISAVHRQAVVNNPDILQGALTTYERVLGIMANQYFASQPAGRVKGRPRPRPGIPAPLPPRLLAPGARP